MGKHSSNETATDRGKHGTEHQGKHREPEAIVTEDASGYAIRTPGRVQGPPHGYDSTR